jgi:hypothetical protein
MSSAYRRLQKKYADDDKLVVVIIGEIPLRNIQVFEIPVVSRVSIAPPGRADLKWQDSQQANRFVGRPRSSQASDRRINPHLAPSGPRDSSGIR